MRARLALALLALAAAAPAAAGPLETLVMPGPVIEAHAKNESECTSCHRPFDRAAEDALCVECHEDVGADLSRGEGFHGRAPGLEATPCRSCHTDHEGRDADIVGLDEALFDHALTDHPLRGAHRAVSCAGCHPADAKHREAPGDCVGCHAEDDPHRERLGTACGDCHGETTWKRADFDHATTDFLLEGAHADVACGQCHAGERYEDTPRDCASCHVLDDVHRGRFGARCGDCHGVATWTARFDHDRDTDFRLTGRHRDAACASCHPGALFEEPAPRDCATCHAAEDVHRGGNGPECQSCHDTASWARVAFDHDRDTEFALRGAHAQVRCESCHTAPVHEQELESDCASCHARDDVHGGEQGTDCVACHGETGWRTEVRFDHDLARLPLLGLHATAPCESCHASHRYREAETACVACHRAEDAHDARLTLACADCHNPNGWALWRFDHDARTSFALHGGHEGLDCVACHTTPAPETIELGDACADCHAAEDPHRGEFGRDCQRCHVEEDWKAVALPR